MTLWMRWLSVLSLALSLSLAGVACQTKTEQNAETKAEQKKENESPKKKGKADYQVQKITIPSIPQSLDEFRKLREVLAKTPEGGAALFIAAILAHHAKNPQAPQMAALTFTPIHLSNGELGTQMKERIVRGLGERVNVAPSYVVGTSPSNGYKLPAPPFTVEMHTDPLDNGFGADTRKLFLWSSGAELPRGIEMRQLDGFWQVENASSLLSDVAKPTK